MSILDSENEEVKTLKLIRERFSTLGYAIGSGVIAAAISGFLLQCRQRGFRNVITGVSLPRDMLFYGGIYFAGDLSQQFLRRGPDKGEADGIFRGVDFLHSARIGLVTTTFFGPGFHKLYRFMDRRWPGRDFRTVALKVSLDQLLGTGIGLGVFFTSLAVLEQHDDYTADVRAKYFPAWISGAIFWPTVNMFNFRFVPSQYRVIYISCAAFVWTNFLCYLRDTYSA